jgi:hypothetical protein
MRCTLVLASLVALLFVLPVRADDKKADPAKMPADKKEATDKMIAAGEITGKLLNVEPNKKAFTVQVTVKLPVPNPGAMQNLMNLQMQLSRPMPAAQRMQLMMQLQQQQANLVQIKQENQSIDIDSTDDIKVRIPNPPVEFDEKGKPKVYTKDQLKEMKGDPKLPGYQADFDSLHPDQVVTVYLVKKKDTPKPKMKDADKDPLEAENKPVASMVIIQMEPPPMK